MKKMLPPQRTVPLLLAVVLLAGCEPQQAVTYSSANAAPEGVYFLKVAAQGQLEGKPVEKRPGSMLNRVGENTYQSTEGVVLQLRPEQVTNDMAVVKLIEKEERARERERQRREAMATPVPTPTPKPEWSNPLGKGAYDQRQNRNRTYYPTPAPYYPR